MAILKVLKYGDPRLRMPAKRVEKVSAKIQRLIKDLFDTMYALNGCGLAATQVGEPYQVFVLDCNTEEDPQPQMVFINPKIVKKEGACLSKEGCLSFPEVFTEVARYSAITVRYMDSYGHRKEMTVEGGTLLARAIQHELDHLNGVLFVDHALDEVATNASLKAQALPSIDPKRKVSEEDLVTLITSAETLETQEVS
ncbi:MAG: peptide deformylase [Vampirovibrionales bacterium]